MIKINLARPTKAIISGVTQVGYSPNMGGESAAEMAASADDIRRKGLVKLLILFLFPAALMVYEQQNLPKIQAEASRLDQELNTLKEYNGKEANVVDEIKKFKAEEKRIQSSIEVIESVSKSRLKVVKIFDMIQQVIPEKAWLEKVDVKNDRITIVGYASNDSDLSAFMDALAKSVFLVDVNLLNSSESIVNGQPIKRFEILCPMEKGS